MQFLGVVAGRWGAPDRRAKVERADEMDFEHAEGFCRPGSRVDLPERRGFELRCPSWGASVTSIVPLLRLAHCSCR